MAKLEPKQVQKELDQGRLRAFYWLYGPETLKGKELFKRIRAKIEEKDPQFQASLSQEVFEAGETDSQSVKDSALSPSLLGGTRLLVIRDAHLLKDSETLQDLFGGEAAPATGLPGSVVVAFAKDLDQRKKFSKRLVESDEGVAVSCEAVLDQDRAQWVRFLAERKKVTLNPELVTRLEGMDPWGLELLERELEKLELALPSDQSEVILGGELGEKGSEALIDAVLSRSRRQASTLGYEVFSEPESVFPFLGLLAWNLRSLILFVKDQKDRTRFARMNPYLQPRFEKWARLWTVDELLSFQKRLSEIDFSLKQRPLEAKALWQDCVFAYCQKA